MAERLYPKGEKQGVGKECLAMLRRGRTNDEILADLKAKFPTATINAAGVKWYRNHFRKKDPTIPMARDARPRQPKPAFLERYEGPDPLDLP